MTAKIFVSLRFTTTAASSHYGNIWIPISGSLRVFVVNLSRAALRRQHAGLVRK